MVRYSELRGLYEVEKTVGCGGFAKVKVATHIATGEKVAIKIMDKTRLGENLPRVKLELKALKTLSHQHICKLYQVIDTESHVFIIVEYCSGGELFDHIVEKNRLTEAESRTFFRQIVSAVAYLHSLGYAHRDLKPENVLLDKNLNIKLIDFGLCANPEGGIQNPLHTSCGSPTYAAPELVLGRQYLGPEVDVWAMGVLLYALLAGALPFDDINIDTLYKKILRGRYEEPSFMSPESKRLIRSMLQVDPKRRITVTELLSHPWLTLGVLEPVVVISENSKRYDKDSVMAMAKYYDVEPDIMWKYLKTWQYDYHTATYLLLISKKKKNSPLKLRTLPIHMQLKLRLEATPKRPKPPLKPLSIAQVASEGNKKIMISPVPCFNGAAFGNDENSSPLNVKANISATKQTPNNTPINCTRQGMKRFRSPPRGGCHASPVPAKKAAAAAAIIERFTPKTPEKKKGLNCGDTPGSARRVLGSIERSLHKVRHVLTPRKQVVETATQPVVLSSKGVCNVSTTQCSDPEYVIMELTRVFQRKGFQCERKGFILSGKVEANVLHHCNGCSFELEICYLPCMGPMIQMVQNSNTPTRSILKNGPLNTPSNANSSLSTPNSAKTITDKNYGFVGIRRRRLKGDSWCYKKVCEEVMAVTVKDFRPITESAV